MFGYVLKVSFLCCMVAWAWLSINASTLPDVELAYTFLALEVTVLIVFLILRMVFRFADWIMWKLTYDIRYWRGPTITFEGHDKKFVPIIGFTGSWSASQREKYWDTFSDEDRELYGTTYCEEVGAWNAQQQADEQEWISSGGPEREAAYEANRRAEKAEKRAARENRKSSYPSSWSNPTPNPQRQSTPQRQPQTYPTKAPTPHKQPEKFRVQEMRPGMSKYTNRTSGTDLMNAQKQLEGAQRQRATTAGAEKIKYRIVDKDGKVQ